MSLQFRISDRSLTDTALTGLQTSLSRLSKLQQQLSSGKVLSKPSDDPTAAAAAMQLRSDIQVHQQYSRNADDGLGWLGTIDTTLTNSMDQIQRVRDLTLQAMSTGGNPTANNDAYAMEADNIRQAMVQVANTQYLGRPVFGGSTSGTAAYDSTGQYQGDATPVVRTVGDNTKVQVDSSGPQVFGADTDPTQLFAVLTGIVTDMRTNPTALPADLANLDAATNRMKSALSDVGARYNRVTDMQKTVEDRLVDLKSQLSDVEDVDLPKTITELQMQQVAYQSALAATAKVLQPSLIDFLK